MRSFIACVVLLLVQLARADQVIDINNGTDRALAFANKLLTQRGMGILPLPPLIYDDIQMYKGSLVGMNSLERTQNATITLKNNGTIVTLDLHVGRSLYDLVFGLMKLDGDEMTAVFRIKNNSMHISFTLFNETNCHIRLNNYEYETLTDVSFESNLPNYGGDVSDVFQKTVLSRINEKLEAKKPQLERAIQVAVCRRHFHHQDATLLSQILFPAFLPN